MTETLYVLNNDPAEPRHAPVVGTKCIMYYRPKDDGTGDIIDEEKFINETNTGFAIIEITRNHHPEKPDGSPMAFGDYVPPTNPLQYTANTHPGLITVLSTINPPRFAEFKPEDWNREDIPAAPPGTIFDPFYESAHYKILALGSRYTSKKKPKFDLRINIRNNYNDSWLKWMYEKVLYTLPDAYPVTFHTCDKGSGNPARPTSWLEFTIGGIKEGDEIFLSIDGDHTHWQTCARGHEQPSIDSDVNTYFKLGNSEDGQRVHRDENVMR